MMKGADQLKDEEIFQHPKIEHRKNQRRDCFAVQHEEHGKQEEKKNNEKMAVKITRPLLVKTRIK